MVTTYAPVYLADRWEHIVDEMQGALAGRKMTNAEAAAAIEQWQLVARDEQKIAFQLAAHAFGWDPPRTVQMTNAAAQGRKPYMIPKALWGWARMVAKDLDDHRSDADPPPRIAVDRDTFNSPTFYGRVRAELQNDGLLDIRARKRVDAAVKIPLPTCVDTKTGKRRFPRPGDTDKTCRVDVVDDPVTSAAQSLWSLALMVGALWLLAQSTDTRHRR